MSERPRRKRPTGRIAASVIMSALTAVEAVAVAENPTSSMPAHACTSPVVSSDRYPGNPHASNLWMTDSGFGPSGVLIQATVPPGVFGVRITWRNPNDGQVAWNENASPVVKPDATGHVALKAAIGEGAVYFGIQDVVEAPAGSPLCGVQPTDVSFTYKTAGEYFKTSGTVPWPSFLNVSQVVNLF